MIKHEDGKWCLYTKDGTKKLGTHDTEAEAVAQEQAIEAAKHRAAEGMRYVTLLGATGTVRAAQKDGKDWLVVPVVALVEGVIHPVNAPTPELVRAERFSASLGEWEGKPLMAGHPMRGREPVSVASNPSLLAESFGHVMAPRVDGKRLCMEAWMDPSRMASGHPAKILEAVKAEPPKSVEVSVGVFTAMESRDATWTNGRVYKAEWMQMRPDHLALFADGRKGACSVEMGCGLPRIAMRVAANGELEDVVETFEVVEKEGTTMNGIKERFASFFRSLMPRGWGDDEVKQELRDALLAIEPAFRQGEILRVTNDAVVYCLYPPPPMYYDAGSAPPELTYWSRGYTFDTTTKQFNLSADRTQVYPATVYEPVKAAEGMTPDVPAQTALVGPTITAACGCGGTKPAASAAQGEIMNKQERIAALVANPHNAVKDAKILEALTDDGLKALEDAAGTLKVAADKAAADKIALDKATADLKVAQDALAAPITEERLPADMRALLAAKKAEDEAKKTELVGKLKVAQTAFTEAELNDKGIGELVKLATALKVDAPKPDFSGRGVPRAAAAGEDFKAPDPWAKKTPAAATH